MSDPNESDTTDGDEPQDDDSTGPGDESPARGVVDPDLEDPPEPSEPA